jgi:CCR4-NOT transcription complex subunit 7/8
MDTEFPGVVARPVAESYAPDYHYQSLKCNVDLLRIIQLGLAFADEVRMGKKQKQQGT